MRFIQGSGTVAMIIAASISAPILAQIPGVNMLLAAQAATMGSLFFGYFNDSLFWVVNRMMGINDVKNKWSFGLYQPRLLGDWWYFSNFANLIFGNDGSVFDLLFPVVVLVSILFYIKFQNKNL